jgi:calcineurin-like phosphoesterase family protein
MTIWYTADTHFGHAKIIEHCNRPFATKDDMDAALIRNWNNRIRPTDTVYHGGDFTFRSPHHIDYYLEQLNGQKHLIWGNHDDNKTRKSRLWTSSQPMVELKISGKLIVLLHYGMRVWRNSGRGSLHFFGHSHGKLPGDSQSCDIGVDCWDFKPVTLEDIEARLATLPQRKSEHTASSDQ